MTVIITDNQSKEEIGKVILRTKPQNGECIEFNQKTYLIYRVVHTSNAIKLLVVDAR